MWAIYYVHPDTGVRYPCQSSGHRQFGPPGSPPALFVSKKNAVKTIYDLAKFDKDMAEHASTHGYTTMDRNSSLYVPGQPHVDLGFEKDYANWHVVPVTISPNFSDAEVEGNVLTDRQRKTLGL